MKYIASGFGGAVIGGLIVFFILWQTLPTQMVSVHTSSMGFEETAAHIEKRVKAAGWKMPKVYDLQKSLANAGYEIPRIRVYSLCNPAHANRLLGKDDLRFVSAMMPCRIAVFEQGGSTRIASMNVQMLSRMFGGEIAEVMTDVAGEQQEMLAEILSGDGE